MQGYPQALLIKMSADERWVNLPAQKCSLKR